MNEGGLSGRDVLGIFGLGGVVGVGGRVVVIVIFVRPGGAGGGGWLVKSLRTVG